MGNKLCQAPLNQDNQPQKRQLSGQQRLFWLETETNKSQSELLGSQLNHQNIDNYCSRMGNWLDSLQDTYYIHKSSDKQKTGNSSYEVGSEIQEYDLDPKEIAKYAKNLPYCKTNLDVMIINSYIMDKKNFLQRLREGPPKQRIRWSSWQLLIFDSFLKINCNNLTQNPWNEEDSQAIKKDIRRTVVYKECKYFHNQDMSGCSDLEYILIRLSQLYPQLGYCQGMNFLGAFILMVNRKQKEKAFDFLSHMFISPKFMLYYLFANDMPLVQFLVYIFNEELKLTMPSVSKHIDIKLEIHSAFWVNKVFLTLFLYNFHFTICQRFWDVLISSNIFSLVQLLLSLICKEQQKILNFQDLLEFNQWFDQFQNNENYQYFNQIIAESTKYYISSDKVNQYAANFRKINNHELFKQDFKSKKSLSEFIISNTQMNQFIN